MRSVQLELGLPLEGSPGAPLSPHGTPRLQLLKVTLMAKILSSAAFIAACRAAMSDISAYTKSTLDVTRREPRPHREYERDVALILPEHAYSRPLACSLRKLRARNGSHIARCENHSVCIGEEAAARRRTRPFSSSALKEAQGLRLAIPLTGPALISFERLPV